MLINRCAFGLIRIKWKTTFRVSLSHWAFLTIKDLNWRLKQKSMFSSSLESKTKKIRIYSFNFLIRKHQRFLIFQSWKLSRMRASNMLLLWKKVILITMTLIYLKFNAYLENTCAFYRQKHLKICSLCYFYVGPLSPSSPSSFNLSLGY